MAKYITVSATSDCCPAGRGVKNPTAWERTVQDYIDGEVSNVCPQKPDLFVFPEMCGLCAGMEMAAYLANIRQYGDSILHYVAKKAASLHMWIAYSTVRLTENGGMRNSCLLFDRQGALTAVYDKNYLTQGELDAGIEPGSGAVCVDCELGRIGFAICFDLNYPQLAQEYRHRGVDMILFPSLFHGGILRQVWAFTAGCYLICACGGCSAAVIDPVGCEKAASSSYFPWMFVNINLDYLLLHLDFHMDNLNHLCEKYGQRVHVEDPGGLGAVLLFCEDNGLTALELAQEFSIIPREQYLQKMLMENTGAGEITDYDKRRGIT